MSTECAVFPETDITNDMVQQIDRIIEENRGRPGALIPVLSASQDVAGYLPDAVIEQIADGLGVPRSRVFGVVTFYALFSRTPRGRHTVRVCEGTACYVKGSRELVGRIANRFGAGVGETCADRRFSVESVRCLGACGLAPVVVVDQDTYGSVTPDSIVGILEEYQ